MGIKIEDQLPGLLFEGFNLLHSSILAGQGVGLAPTAILADDLKAGRIVKLFDTPVLEERAYYITEPANPRESRADEVAMFKAWLLAEAAG